MSAVRNVACALCGRPMFYTGDPKHEPEVRLTVESGDDEWRGYAHSRCWHWQMAITADAIREECARICDAGADGTSEQFAAGCRSCAALIRMEKQP